MGLDKATSAPAAASQASGKDRATEARRAAETDARRLKRTPAEQGAWLAAACAIGLYQLGITLLNTAVFPLFNVVFLEARDLGSLFSATLSLALYALVSVRPQLCRPRLWMAAAAALYVIGVPAMLVGVWAGSPVLLTLGVLMRSVASTWFGTTICLQLTNLGMEQGARRTFGALCAGWALSYALELATGLLSLTGQLAVFFVSALLVMALSFRPSRGLVEHMAKSAPASELRVTNPRSFLPVGSALFVTIVLLKASFGFAMTFASVDAAPQATVLACVPALLVACALLACNRVGLDSLYKAAMLSVLAGFLLVNPLISSMTGAPALANVMLRAGGDLTRMLAFMLVASLGARNPMAAAGVSLFVGGANSLGSVAGAQLGILANATLARDPALFALLLAGVVFAFVAYNVLSPDVFNFDRAVREVETVKPVQEVEQAGATDSLAEAVSRAVSRFGLTPREAEALELLAHGRNTAAIQERMVVSRSTAKTHVRNVYAKLGVHSQQDLIDLVEGMK